jgi:putative ATP-binding cassette transporter
MIQTYTEVITEITMAILFIVGPLSLIVGLIPYLGKCNEAAKAIFNLEEALDAGREAAMATPAVGAAVPRQFDVVTLDSVRFSYQGDEEETFVLGPVSLTIKNGEILFIIGGNGSGKSTLLKLLSGLYRPDSGQILVDGVEVRNGNIQDYREMFSAIFSDFHLFEKLYGHLGVEEARVSTLLKDMYLDRKVRFAGDRFSTLELSTGQKKRLALVVSLLDSRPIYVFDELAADQDPEFRRYLYEQLLPRIRNEGHTIIAATHDDRYFHVADRVVKLEIGKVVEVTTDKTS